MQGARLAVLSHVDYRSGEILPFDAVDGLVLWDLSHAAGAIEIDLSAQQLAVGCTYKYLNGGPGAPAFLYVREDLQAQLRSPIQGWFGQREQFAMGPAYDPAPGIERFLAGTPPILELTAVALGRRAHRRGRHGADRREDPRAHRPLRRAARRVARAARASASPRPRDATPRGGHVSLAHPDGWQICRALIERANVVPDFRRPDRVRFGFPALYTRYADVYEAAKRTKDLVALGAHREIKAPPARVT